jgi:uncharacterized damage-inducible protein DinB
MNPPDTPTLSGRPEEGEYAAYQKADIDLVPGNSAVAALEASAQQTLELLGNLDESRIDHSYAPDKWTIRQILGHMIDDERIFVYRALCLARGEQQPLPSFDEKDYVRQAGFEDRPWAELLAEYLSVREATLTFFQGISDKSWLRRGTVTDYTASVRGLAFHIAAHELHHLRVLQERYLAT